MLEHRDEIFAKTALMINCEHTSTIQTYLLGEDIRHSNMYTGMLWYAGGSQRPKLQDLAVQLEVVPQTRTAVDRPVGGAHNLHPQVIELEPGLIGRRRHAVPPRRGRNSPDRRPLSTIG